MKKTVEQNGIKLTLAFNADETVDLKVMMHVEYADDSGQITEFDAYPDIIPGEKFGTAKTQFEYIESVLIFNNVVAESTLKNIKQFLADRPQLSISGISEEAGFSKRYLSFILSGERPITINVIEKLLPIMLKYGFGRK